MARVRYKGEADRLPCHVFGLDFEPGEWVEVDGLAAEKLPANPMFEAEEAEGEGGETGPTVDELRAALDAVGVKYHHKAGAEKLQALLADHAAGVTEGEGGE